MEIQAENIKLPSIRCQQFNHDQMLFEYVCLEKQCLAFNKNPLCFCCITYFHSQHIQSALSLSQFVVECMKIAQPKTNNFQNQTNEGHQEFFKLQNLLLKGLPYCKNKQQLSGILEQIYKATFNSSVSNRRKQQILNQEINKMKAQTQSYYANERQNVPKSGTIPNKRQNLTKSTNFKVPILSFLHDQMVRTQNYDIISPFQIKHKRSKSISSIFAYPSLSTLTQSTQVFVKILRLTPNWMGIGVSIGDLKYEQSSKNHITLLSNGWINQKGKMNKSNSLSFKAGQTIKILWNKDKKQLIFRNTTTRNQQTIKFQPEWNEQVYLCFSMFFEGDSLAIVQQQSQ